MSTDISLIATGPAAHLAAKAVKDAGATSHGENGREPRARNGWIAINTSGFPGHLHCLRCGKRHDMFKRNGAGDAIPQELWVADALLRGFAKEHRRCKRRPGGQFCAYCGNQHAGVQCPKLSPKSAQEWIMGPDTGTSSRTIFAVLFPSERAYHEDCNGRPRAGIPHDPDDFGRCYRLLRAVPEWRARLPEVAAKHPEWAPFVREWDRLTALWEKEEPSGRCPKLYAMMRALVDEARNTRVLAGGG